MNEHQQETHLPIALALLRDNELAIAALYGEYALLFPTQASFWLTLAEEEQQHATWIGDLGHALNDSLTAAGPRFSPAAIETFTRYVHEQSALARRKGLSSMAALTTSYYIETALIERRFFEQLPTRDPAVARVMTELKRSTAQHVRKVEGALHQSRPGSF